MTHQTSLACHAVILIHLCHTSHTLLDTRLLTHLPNTSSRSTSEYHPSQSTASSPLTYPLDPPLLTYHINPLDITLLPGVARSIARLHGQRRGGHSLLLPGQTRPPRAGHDLYSPQVCVHGCRSDPATWVSRRVDHTIRSTPSRGTPRRGASRRYTPTRGVFSRDSTTVRCARTRGDVGCGTVSAVGCETGPCGWSAGLSNGHRTPAQKSHPTTTSTPPQQQCSTADSFLPASTRTPHAFADRVTAWIVSRSFGWHWQSCQLHPEKHHHRD